jgi:hypothetical protein
MSEHCSRTTVARNFEIFIILNRQFYLYNHIIGIIEPTRHHLVAYHNCSIVAKDVGIPG